MIKIEVVPIPETRYGKYRHIRQALLALAPGQAIRLPSDFFGATKTGRRRYGSSFLRMERYGRKVHQMTLADGVYLWLSDPISEKPGEQPRRTA